MITFETFLLVLRALAELQQGELVQHGILRQDDMRAWRAYCADPVRWFLCANSGTQMQLWQAAVARMEMIDRATEKARKKKVAP